jgi:hypothetical protein
MLLRYNVGSTFLRYLGRDPGDVITIYDFHQYLEIFSGVNDYRTSSVLRQ